MKMLKAIYWRAYILRLALRWVPRFNLGDRVECIGREWVLNQGVDAPYWTLVRNEENMRAHEHEFYKVRSLSNYWHSFRSGYRFYMTNWYSIWMREGITDWMRGCNIWARKRPL